MFKSTGDLSMSKISISQAAKEWKIARNKISQAIKSGEITSTTGARNSKNVDTTDMIRVFGEPSSDSSTESKTMINQNNNQDKVIEILEKNNSELRSDVEYYRLELKAKEEKIEALKSEILAFSSGGIFKRLNYRPN
jgi:hypothetical protein